MGRIFEKNTVYHSYLARMSPVIMQFSANPIDSKYNDPVTGEPKRIVYFKINGDDYDGYCHLIENSDIDEAIQAAPKQTWMTVDFAGRAEDAVISFRNADKSAITPTASGAVIVESGDYDEGYISGNYEKCLQEAGRIAGEYGFEDVELTALHAVAATLFINWSYKNYAVPMSASDFDSASADEEGEDDVSMEFVLLEKIDLLTKTSGKSHDGKALKTVLRSLDELVNQEGGIDNESFHKAGKWLDVELIYQTPDEELMTDELPF